MKKIILSIVLVVATIGSIFTLTGCNEKVESNTENLSKDENNEITQLESEVTETEEISIETFCEYNDYTYYWELSENSRDTSGIYGNYYYTNNDNKLVRISNDGEKETVYEGEGFGDITIVNNRIFTYKSYDSEGYYYYLFSMDLNGENMIVYDDVCAKMKTVVGNLIICETTKDDKYIFSLDTTTGEISKIIENANYIGKGDNVVYYELNYYTEYNNSGEEYLKIGTIKYGKDEGILTKLPTSEFETYGESVTNYSTEFFLAKNEYLYISYGYRGGSGNGLQKANICKISLKDGNIEGTPDASVENLIYLYENSGKEYLLISSTTGIDLDTFKSVQLDIEIGDIYDYVYINQTSSAVESINYIEDLTGNINTILTKEDLKTYGFEVNDSECFTSIFKYTVTDSYVYLILDQGIHNSENDIGWRYSYDRSKTVMLRYNKSTNEIFILSDF